MENKKVVVEFVQTTYDLESLLLKMESLYKKIYMMQEQIDIKELTPDEVEVLQCSIARVMKTAERLKEVYK